MNEREFVEIGRWNYIAFWIVTIGSFILGLICGFVILGAIE